MSFIVEEIKPFLCKTSDLEKLLFSDLQKRQIIAPFKPHYFFARFLELADDDLIVKDRSEIDLKKIIAKISYHDFIMLSDVFAEFASQYDKFNKFYETFKLTRP